MESITKLLVILAISIPVAMATTIGEHSEGGHSAPAFCYSDEEGCGPNTDAWAPLCHTGLRQSPINIPYIPMATGKVTLNLKAYQGDHFRIQNNGHSVQIDFNNEGPSTQLLTFPDPLKTNLANFLFRDNRQYKFSSAHFHWGVNDSSPGSEHCIENKCTAMELHLVHYWSQYQSVAEAVASGDENALAVLGVLINVSPSRSQSALAPVASHLESVVHADHDPSKWTTVDEPLDLGQFLREATASLAKANLYSYKGSLTTPGCNEQVNWYVLGTPVTVGHSEIEPFRNVMDGRSMYLSHNNRDCRPLNNRRVNLSKVTKF